MSWECLEKMSLRTSRERTFNLYFFYMSNNNNSDRTFVGNGKKVGNYDLVNFSINLNKAKDFVYEYKGEKYLKMTMGSNKDGANEYGQTHKVWIDKYNPDSSKNNEKPSGNKEFAKAGDGLPF